MSARKRLGMGGQGLESVGLWAGTFPFLGLYLLSCGGRGLSLHRHLPGFFVSETTLY